MNQNTWRFRQTVRVIFGVLLGFGGLRLINSQQWPDSIGVIASVIVGIISITLISYGPKTYQQYCDQQKKLQ